MSKIVFRAIAFLPLLVPISARAQMQVFDPGNYAQLVNQVAKSAQQIALLETQLQTELQALGKQNSSITPSLQSIIGDLDVLFKSSAGVGYNPVSSSGAFQTTYPSSWAPANAAGGGTLNAPLADWRQKTWNAQSDLIAAQSVVAASMRQNASAVTLAVGNSQAAPGPTAALQSTNQLLSAISGQLGQIASLIVASSRASVSATAEQQAVGGSAAILSSQSLQLPTTSSRISAAGHL